MPRGLFGNGAKPSGALKHPKTLGDTTIAKLRKQLESRAGGENPGGTLILEEGMDWVQFMLSSTDAQFLELRKFAVQEVCRLWRVPLHMVGDLDRTTHSNAEELGQQFLSLCLLPILRLWQDAIKITCLTRGRAQDALPRVSGRRPGPRQSRGADDRVLAGDRLGRAQPERSARARQPRALCRRRGVHAAGQLGAGR